MQVQLKISARNISDLDTLTKSDPQCTVYEQRDEQWVQVGETEEINNTLNPDFARSITVRYYFEKIQKFKFEMKDVDKNDRFDMIGCVEVTMGNLMGAPKQTYSTNLSHNGN